MPVTHIHYDERSFTSAEACLNEIASRLERGWMLSELAATRGRLRALFSWQDPANEHPDVPAKPAGGVR
ncbi:MAG: hypothetical protein WD557_13835 [Dehalococcoidia bacterium]